MNSKDKIFIGKILIGLGMVIAFFGPIIYIITNADDFTILGAILIALVGIIIGASGGSFHSKSKDQLEEEERKKREAKVLKDKVIHDEIISKLTTQDHEIDLAFKEKYGMTFFEFIKIGMRLVDGLSPIDTRSSTKPFYLFLTKLKGKKYFVKVTKPSENHIDNIMSCMVCSDSAFERYKKNMVENGESINKLWTNEIYEVYKNLSLYDVNSYLYSYKDLESVEYVKNISTTHYSRTNSLDLAITEELYGTAAAVNKANNSVGSYTVDNSYVKYRFSSSSRIPVSRTLICYNLDDKLRNTAFKEVWDEKEISIAKAVKIQKAAKSDEDDDVYEKLKRYKKLYDEEIITKQEFDSYKKKLL